MLIKHISMQKYSSLIDKLIPFKLDSSKQLYWVHLECSPFPRMGVYQ